MFTQFQLFILILTLKSMFYRTWKDRWKDTEWYTLVAILVFVLVWNWLVAGWLLEPINAILSK